VKPVVERISEFLHAFLGKSSQTETTAIVLRPGQILQGRVLEINGNRVVLLVNGVNITAELKTSAAAGDRLLLYVEEQKPDGTVILKKIDAEMSGGIIEGGKAEALLNHFGIKVGRLNTALFEKMLQRGISFSASDISMLEAFMIKNSLTEEHVPAVLWLWSRNLPLSKEAVEAVHSFLKGQGFINAEIAKQLFEGSSLPSSVKQEPSSLINLLRNVFFKEDESSGQIAQKLSNLANNLGLKHEREILERAVLDKSGEFQVRDYSNIKNLSAREDPLKSLSIKWEILRLLHSSLSGKEAGDILMPKESLKELLNDITALQLLNLSGQQDSGGSSLFLQGWFLNFEGELSPFFLKLKKFEAEKGGEGDVSCQVLFFITTKHLGKLMCRLALEKGHMTCAFTVEKEKYREIIDDNIALLENKLNVLPWKLIFLSTRVSSHELKENFEKEILEAGTLKTNSLDLRV